MGLLLVMPIFMPIYLIDKGNLLAYTKDRKTKDDRSSLRNLRDRLFPFDQRNIYYD